MEMASFALLRDDDDPSRDTIREGLSGNLCRCNGYVKIIDAVERAASDIRCCKEGK
jgi:carbon-monoxide dehydrogenase small subunit